jgi:Flp pilus assembly protein TadD
MGLLYGQMRRPAEAGVSLRRAVDLDPASAAARGSLALWHESTGDFEAAEREYATNLLLDPQDTSARTGLERVQRARAFSPRRADPMQAAPGFSP